MCPEPYAGPLHAGGPRRNAPTPLIPKGHNTGKWRLITDLSHPPGRSINDAITSEVCSLSYTTVEQVEGVAAGYTRGALLAKIYIEPPHTGSSARSSTASGGMGREVLRRPDAPIRALLGPKTFQCGRRRPGVMSAERKRGIRHVFHHLDDFIVVGPPHSVECSEALSILNQTCAHLGVPIADHKRDGPTTCLTYLGIEVDTVASQLRLLQDKLQRLRIRLAEWGDRKCCGRRELESLIGVLHHACKVVRSGRSFLGRMLDLLRGLPMHRVRLHPIRLNRAF